MWFFTSWPTESQVVNDLLAVHAQGAGQFVHSDFRHLPHHLYQIQPRPSAAPTAPCSMRAEAAAPASATTAWGAGRSRPPSASFSPQPQARHAVLLRGPPHPPGRAGPRVGRQQHQAGPAPPDGPQALVLARRQLARGFGDKPAPPGGIHGAGRPTCRRGAGARHPGLGRCSARSRRLAFSACSRQRTSGHTYAPRPDSLPVRIYRHVAGPACAPPGPARGRGVTVRQPTHVRIRYFALCHPLAFLLALSPVLPSTSRPAP